MNGIIGMVNMGNQYADDPQMQQKIREKAMETLKYLVSLVNDVLDMNKLQSGDLKDQQLTFDLTEVLREDVYKRQAIVIQVIRIRIPIIIPATVEIIVPTIHRLITAVMCRHREETERQ